MPLPWIQHVIGIAYLAASWALFAWSAVRGSQLTPPETLAVIVPFLRARGMSLQEWMAWGVILTAIVACVGPDVYSRLRRRNGFRS